MIIVQQPISLEQLPSSAAILPRDTVFFDIETTGLSRRSSHLYMIGTAAFEKDRYILTQWLLQRPSEEREVLELFASYVKQFKAIIHYNGQTFDLPYLRDRCRHWNLPDPFPENSICSLDLYRELLPMKKLLPLSSMKQKDLELLLAFPREDRMSGKELISVYHHYLEQAGEKELQLLLLHNRDDLLGMLSIYPFYLYLHRLSEASGSNLQDEPSTADPFLLFDLPQNVLIRNDTLTLQIKTAVSCPKELHFRGEAAAMHILQDQITLQVYGTRGLLRHYFSNYKDYYYLPLEDTAVHKSVGIYVDPSCRRKAKADNCYTKKEGLFFFQPQPVFQPDFRKDTRKGPSFFPSDLIEKDPSLLQEYSCALISFLLKP
ncbi:MAG: ribonuclease H-like domain-containing protein [Lachnospiraceae bacterium]|nr:ribonuclease H-like domain-containing protein [Lachnospiraceae bacterium]